MKTLRVYANPYSFVHPEHGPQGVFPVDPVLSPGVRRWVGAKLCPKRTKITEKRPAGDPRGDRQVTCFVFSGEAVELPASNYYIAALRNGDLVPADAVTSKLDCKFATLDAAAKAVGLQHTTTPKTDGKGAPK